MIPRNIHKLTEQDMFWLDFQGYCLADVIPCRYNIKCKLDWLQKRYDNKFMTFEEMKQEAIKYVENEK